MTVVPVADEVRRMIRIITIEREFGCGGPEVARRLAALLGWKLWDELLTLEIAPLTKSAPEAVERREWRKDPLVYRVFKSFVGGAFEGSLPPLGQLELLDADRIAKVSEQVVREASIDGPCVIVGRGSQYFLKHREDVFRVFLYAPRQERIRRLISAGKPQGEAIEQVETIDRERAAFIKKYFGLDWPDRHLYHVMLNTMIGDARVVDLIHHFVQQFDR